MKHQMRSLCSKMHCHNSLFRSLGVFMKKLALVLIGVASLSACVSMPQTQDEFRKGVAAGAAFTRTSTHTVNRPFSTVTSSLKEKASQCLNFRDTWARRQGGLVTSSMTIEYNASFRMVSSSRAELTIQHTPRGQRMGPQMPEGGFYWMVVDIDLLSTNITKLTFYGPSGNDKVYGAIKSWSNGTPQACPFS
jgi:hypothetical protein